MYEGHSPRDAGQKDGGYGHDDGYDPARHWVAMRADGDGGHRGGVDGVDGVHGRVVHGVIWMEWLGTGGLPKHLIRAASLAGAIQITQVTSFRKRQYLEFNFHAILP